MKHKKLMAILLAGTVLLAGCGKKPETSEEPASGDTETEVSESISSETNETEVAAASEIVVTEATAASAVETTEAAADPSINYASEAWYSSNVPVESIYFENSVQTTWRGYGMYCYYPGTDVTITVNPATDAQTLKVNVLYLSFDERDEMAGTEFSSIPASDYAIYEQEVTADADGNFSLSWTDEHAEEWLGIMYVFINGTDGDTTSIIAQCTVGVPTLVAEA